MGSYKVRRLKIPQNIIEIFEKNKLNSCKDVLSLTKIEIQTMLGINLVQVENILNKIGEKCVSEPKTVHELYLNQESTLSNGFLPLSLHSLDLLLQGGLPFGSITEFAGPPGVGKTQFCFMLSILTALPFSAGGLESNVVYIDTESAFSAERLGTMAQKKFPNVYKNSINLAHLLQKILVHKASSVSALKEILPTLEKEIIRNKVKVIIMDSIASLIRKECGTESMNSRMERNKLLLEQAAALRNLAQSYNIVVFLTNQITSHITEIDSITPDVEDEDCDNTGEEDPPPAPPQKRAKLQGVNSDHVIPALGNTWAHCVNTRLVAQFLNSSVRQLTIAKSPVAPNAAVRYILDERGIVLTDDDIVFVNMSDQLKRTLHTKYSFLTTDITGTGKVFTASITN